jgi:hypothetical protein
MISRRRRRRRQAITWGCAALVVVAMVWATRHSSAFSGSAFFFSTEGPVLRGARAAEEETTAVAHDPSSSLASQVVLPRAAVDNATRERTRGDANATRSQLAPHFAGGVCTAVDVGAPSALLYLAFLRSVAEDGVSAAALAASALRARTAAALADVLRAADAWDPSPALLATDAEMRRLAMFDELQFDSLTLWFRLCAAQRFDLSQYGEEGAARKGDGEGGGAAEALRSAGRSRWRDRVRAQLAERSGTDAAELAAMSAPARDALFMRYADRERGVQLLGRARGAMLSARREHHPAPAAWVDTVSRAVLERGAAPVTVFVAFLSASARRDGRGASGLDALSAAELRNSVISELAEALHAAPAALQRFTEAQLAKIVELLRLPPLERLLVSRGAWSVAAHRFAAAHVPPGAPRNAFDSATRDAAEACLAEELRAPLPLVRAMDVGARDSAAAERSRVLFVGLLMPALAGGADDVDIDGGRAPGPRASGDARGAALAELATETSGGARLSADAVYAALCRRTRAPSACPPRGDAGALRNAAIATLSEATRAPSAELQAFAPTALTALALWFAMEPAQQLLFAYRRFDPTAPGDGGASAWTRTRERAAKLVADLDLRRARIAGGAVGAAGAGRSAGKAPTQRDYVAHIDPGDAYGALVEFSGGTAWAPSIALRAKRVASASGASGTVFDALLSARATSCSGAASAAPYAVRATTARAALLRFAGYAADGDGVSIATLRNSAVRALLCTVTFNANLAHNLTRSP